MAERILEENRNPSSVDPLARSYSHRRAGTQLGNPDVGKGMESTKRAVLFYFNEKETELFLGNPGSTT